MTPTSVIDGGVGSAVEGTRSSGLSTAGTSLARTARVRCQRPHFAATPGYAEGFLLLDECDAAAAVLIVHRAVESRRRDGRGEVVAFAHRERVTVVQVAAACLGHAATALRLNEVERRVLASPRTTTFRAREHVDVLVIGAPVQVARVAA